MYDNKGRKLKIHDFARDGDIAGVAGELAAGVAVDCLELCSGQTALQCVSAMPDASLEMIRFLVEAGASVSPEVFRAAVQSGSLDTIRFLLQSGAKMDYREEGGCGTLAYAAYGRTDPDDTSLIPVLELLIENGADVNLTSSYSESALRITANRGRFDAVQFLLDHGADPESLEWTALMRAVALGTVEEVKALLEQGARLGEWDTWDRSA